MNGYSAEFSYGLNRLKDEILLFKDESSIWSKPGGVSNSPANLALHICGNLKHNIGAEIGGNGFIRRRETEFTKTGLTRNEIIAEIDDTFNMIIPILENLKPEDINKPFPCNIHGEGQTFGSVLAKIALHLGYHLGQINYQRRLAEK